MAMIEVTKEEFEKIIAEALDSLPSEHATSIKNVAITWNEDPTPQQREELLLRDDQTLFGLYQGIPLARRQGHTALLPDKITLFKGPLCRSINDIKGLQEQVRHTLWHEIAHYFGLNHSQIHDLE